MGSTFPWMRWVALLWLLVWVPSYWQVWGAANFLHFCDIAVILTCVGLWRGSALLLSSQAVSSIVGDLLWCADVGWRLLFGQHLVGGTEYMWESQFPLAVRLISLFHAFWPVLLIWSLRRVGYDRRGLLVQSGIALLALTAARFVDPAANINYAFRDPIFGRSWGPAPLHLAVIYVCLVAVIYWPTHQLLARSLRSSAASTWKHSD